MDSIPYVKFIGIMDHFYPPPHPHDHLHISREIGPCPLPCPVRLGGILTLCWPGPRPAPAPCLFCCPVLWSGGRSSSLLLCLPPPPPTQGRVCTYYLLWSWSDYFPKYVTKYCNNFLMQNVSSAFLRYSMSVFPYQG
jgi:hypothetical protein